MTAARFRGLPTVTPEPSELQAYSANPRNRYGEWYQDHVDALVASVGGDHVWCASTDSEARAAMAGYQSPVYGTRKIPDLVVRDRGSTRYLGLELKYLKGDGSLVRPKALADALDFSHRPIDCIYVIDGEGWKSGHNVEWLESLWQFASSATLVDALDDYFQ